MIFEIGSLVFLAWIISKIKIPSQPVQPWLVETELNPIAVTNPAQNTQLTERPVQYQVAGSSLGDRLHAIRVKQAQQDADLQPTADAFNQNKIPQAVVQYPQGYTPLIMAFSPKTSTITKNGHTIINAAGRMA